MQCAVIFEMFRWASYRKLPSRNGMINFMASNFSSISKGEDTLSISIVGRPNTGKSTLFNRLTRSKLAIVSSVPGNTVISLGSTYLRYLLGTTRDRKVARGNIAGLPLDVVDTGGLDDRGSVSTQMQAQVSAAISESDVILFLLDAQVGVTALDIHFAQWIRKTIQQSEDSRHASEEKKKQVIVVANKSEGAHLSERVLDTFAEACRLGFGEPLLMSAAHG